MNQDMMNKEETLRESLIQVYRLIKSGISFNSLSIIKLDTGKCLVAVGQKIKKNQDVIIESFQPFKGKGEFDPLNHDKAEDWVDFIIPHLHTGMKIISKGE